jgi:predicted  nucleic acid-binding Zn-ribbon protein
MPLTDVLKELFLIDQQVRGLESRMDGARRHVQAQTAKIATLNKQLATLTEQHRLAQATQAGFENEAAVFEERVTKLRDQMNAVHTNKEYSALLVEVNTAKADKAKIEEKTLDVMTQVEGLKAQVDQVKATIADYEKVKAVGDKELADRQAEVGEQLAEVKTRRAVAAAHVPADVLATFDRLADNFDGEAMSPVIQEDPRDMEFTCGGCYMSIPPETVNRLYSTQEKLVFCPSCRRILYLEKSMKESMGSK